MSTNAIQAGTDPRYPIGRFTPPATSTFEDRHRAIDDLTQLPALLRSAVQGLSEVQLDSPYRDGGWTVRQLVHHVAESHWHAVSRFRFALTEDEPTIKPYDEAAGAMLQDSLTAPVEWSLALLEALHARWVLLLQQLTDDQWQRVYLHPENGRTALSKAVLLYGWHSRHHTAHVTHLRAAKGW